MECIEQESDYQTIAHTIISIKDPSFTGHIPSVYSYRSLSVARASLDKHVAEFIEWHRSKLTNQTSQMKECKCDCELHPVSSKRSTKIKTEESDIKHPPNPVSGYIVVGMFSGALAWRLDRRHHTLSYHIISYLVMS